MVTHGRSFRRVLRTLAVLTAWILGCVPAQQSWARGWDPASWNVRLDARWESNLFPGYAATGPDRGLEGELAVETALRPMAALKLGLTARAGGLAFARFTEARQGWLGGEVSARRGGTQFVLGGTWTPHRVKFPSDPEDATFERLEGRASLRQALRGNLRLRLEGDLERDDYIPSFDARDAHDRAGRVRLDWTAHPALVLRGETEWRRSRADDSNYTQRERGVGGGITLRGRTGRLELSAASRLRRYDEADPGDSNHRRRDRFFEFDLAAARPVARGVELRAALSLDDRSSTRTGRSYEVTSVRLGLSWAGGAE